MRPILLLLLLSSFSASAQDTLARYLQTHAYALDLAHPDDPGIGRLCQTKLAGEKVLMLGEGGSHELDFYFSLKSYFLQLLNSRLGVRSFVMEYGSDLAALCNYYLATGDTTHLPAFSHPHMMDFLKRLYAYNQTVTRPIQMVGIDFERPGTYFSALRLFLPPAPPPAALKEEVDTIAHTGNTLDCPSLLRIDRYLKQSLEKKAPLFEAYFGSNYLAVKTIIGNPGLCSSHLKNRNPHIVERFNLFDRQLGDSLYYCELGAAHVNIVLKNTSWLLNTDKQGPFFHKVFVINVFCKNCQPLHESSSNWSFGSLQEDIETHFIPYCKGSFTLFDLTESNDPSIQRFAACGQFLLVVQNQR